MQSGRELMLKSQDEGKRGSEELLCVPRAFKKLQEVDFSSDQVIFFTALELLMYSWGSPHTHTVINVLSLVCRRKDGGRWRLSLARLARSGAEPR